MLVQHIPMQLQHGHDMLWLSSAHWFKSAMRIVPKDEHNATLDMTQNCAVGAYSSTALC
jgi:hypothetical protein